MKKLFRRMGKLDTPERDSILEGDTYWDEKDDYEYDWDGEEEEGAAEASEYDNAAYETPEELGVEYEAFVEDMDAICEPESEAGFSEEIEPANISEEYGQEDANYFDAVEEAEFDGAEDFLAACGPEEAFDVLEEQADAYATEGVTEQAADVCGHEDQPDNYGVDDGWEYETDEQAPQDELDIVHENAFAEQEDIYTRQDSYKEEADYGEELDYQEELDYREELDYHEKPDYRKELDYQEEPDYREELNYQEEPDYEEESDYVDTAWSDNLVESTPQVRRRTEKAPVSENKSMTAKKSPNARRRRKQSVFEIIGSRIRSMETMDRVMVITGVAVLVLAIVTGSMFIHINTKNRQISGFAEVGKQLEGISLIGEGGLLAVANVHMAKYATPSPEPEQEEPPKEYDEIGYARDVSVEPDFTSIQKDLKIKFINKKTDKLVANVPFSVTVKDPDGKSSIWSDDDMDGIIHKKDITPGTYQVAMEPLKDEKYASYAVFTDSQSVEVKKEIVYEKVNVANEVKKESEVNAAKEDTKKNETVVESTLKDTVAWVESKIISATYNEVPRSTIPDPITLAAVGRALYLSMEESGGEQVPDSSAAESSQTEPPETGEPEMSSSVEDSTEPTPEAPPLTPTPETPPLTPTPEPPVETLAPETPSPTQAPTPEPQTPAPTDSAKPQESETPPLTPSPSPVIPPATDIPATEKPTQSPPAVVSPSPTPILEKGTLSAAPSEMSAVPGNTLVAKATAAGFTAGKKLVYTIVSSNPAVATATIDANGDISISALAEGSALLTAAVNYENGGMETQATSSIRVNVLGNVSVKLDKTSLNIYAEVPSVINAEVPAALASNAVLTAESSDTGIATVSVDKMALTVTGVAEGNAVITVKCKLGEIEVNASCSVTVRKHPREDSVTLLKDADGQQLYVMEGDNYREAVRADYYKADKFFIKGEAKYTGWQTLEGKVYYFQADGTKVTGEQVIQGAKYNFASDGSLVTGSNGAMGIDVSKWNGKIDWNAVKNSGVSYVIIRCGYRGSAQGNLIEDPKFATNIQGATAAGLKVGVYFFTQAVDEREAVEEASMVLEQIKNYRISYPVFLDVEASGGRADGIDRATRTAVCKAFCQTIQNGGYTAGIYANKTWLENKIDTGSLSAYKIWLAQYAASPTYKGRYDLWQYRSTGSVSGISGNVDLNISYLGY